jgi:transposase InsO family protein
VKYAHIYHHRHLWPVRLQCEVLKVSFTGYHQHQLRRQRMASRRHMTEAALLVHIRAIHRELRGAYGWPRMWRELRRRGVRVGKEPVRLLMQQDGIQARGKRRFRVTTTDSKHSMPIAPNLLNRNFTVDRPNVAWTGDVTYIATEEGWLYLAVVIDLFSRRIVGWSMKTTIDRSLVIDALEMASLGRRPAAGKAIFHSDRGSQYASDDFRKVMEMYGLTPSMSRKANCWDNAVTETLFGSLKVERLHGETFISARAAKDAVMNWNLWYNQKRMHSTIGYQSPVEFEKAWQQKQLKAAA